MPIFAVIPLAALAFVLGWLAHRRLSINYKKRWLELVGTLEAKQLEADPEPDPVRQFGSPSPVERQTGNGSPSEHRHVEYVAGQWALSERKSDKGGVIFFAIRRGFDDVKVGESANPARFAALYRRDRENAEAAVHVMNQNR